MSPPPFGGFLPLALTYSFMTYFVYGQVLSITPVSKGGFLGMFARKTNDLKLSTGHIIELPNHRISQENIQVGETRFILANQDMVYKQSRLCDKVAELETLTKNLDSAIAPSLEALRTLNKQDRALVCRALYIGTSTAISVANAVNCVGQAANFIGGATFDPIAFGVSGAIAAGSAGVAYLQVEALEDDLKTRAKVVRRMQRAHSTYRSLMLRYMPYESTGATPLNPEIKSFIGLLRGLSEEFTTTKFWEGNFNDFATA